MRKALPSLILATMVLLSAATPSSSAKLYLKSGEIDTASHFASVVSSPAKQGSGCYLVAFSDTVTRDQKSQLVAAGAEILEYVPDNAFLVRLNHASVPALRVLPGVEWVGEFTAGLKMRPGALAAAKSRRQQFVATLLPGSSERYVRNRAKILGVKVIDSSSGALRVLANQVQMTKLAECAAVAWVEPYTQPRLCNNVAEGIVGVTDVRQNPGLFGSGQIVAVADAGLDTGSVSNITADLAGRVYKTYALRRPGDWSDLNGHGTHVVGSLLGSGVLSGGNPGTHSYNGSFAGYAPEAQLVFQSIGDAGDLVFPPLHLAELFQPAYDDGARVHSDSWGSAVEGEYTTYSNEVDQFIWDHRDFVVTFAVGNDARDLNQDGISDHDSIYAPATAKNCIAVGATESLRTTGGYQMGYGVAWPDDFKAAPLKYDLMSNNAGGMVAWSGRGPTDDGRVKPDICAPGTNIISCRTQSNPSATGWAAYDANYIYWGGTSMATPQVAGSAALVREYYDRERGVSPSAALVKATLINGATDISPGQYGSGSHQEALPAPDVSQGWGRINVKDSVFPDPPVTIEFADESLPIETGQTREYQYTVVDTSVPLRVTLVWTDYPGAPLAAKELVNDLDLTIVSPSGAVLPMYGVCDHVDNVEQIRIATPELGPYLVRVSGHNVPMGPQDYALVVSGGLPNTYIAGTVTSSSGAGVQGAMITLVSSYGVKRVTTNVSGKYLTRVAPATYSVQIAKPGWTFTPRSRVVRVTTQPAANADFQGNGAVGSVSGRITSAVGGVVSHTVESSHPYLNNCDQTYMITAHEGATRVRVHFAEIDLMNDGDAVYVLDEEDNIKNTFTGSGEDIWSSWATGRVIKIRIVTNDVGNIGYGFYADGYETDLIDQGNLSGASVTLVPGGYQTQTGTDGVYTFSSVPPGAYTVSPDKAHWKFQPDSKTVEVPAGGATQNVDFLAFPPGSITGQVSTVSSAVASVDVQSPHPYPIDYEETWTVTASPGATRMRLHFSRIDTEPAFDLIYVMDDAESIVEIYTALEEDLWTPWINGNIAKIMLSSDSGIDGWGFACDRYETQTIGSGLADVSVILAPSGRQTTTGSLGAFSLSDVDVGSHTVTCNLVPWSFDPASTAVAISPGTQQSLLFYASMSGLTMPSEAKALPDGAIVTLSGVVISARFNGSFYAQDSSRRSGIRVTWTGSVTEGSVVDITGTLATSNGERHIAATSVTPH